MSKQVPLYEVRIDSQTGRWLGDAENTGTAVDFAEWCAKEDIEGLHFDHYESAPDEDGKTETRALRCILVAS